MGHPQTVGELVQIFPAVNWLLTSLSWLAEVVEPSSAAGEVHRGS